MERKTLHDFIHMWQIEKSNEINKTKINLFLLLPISGTRRQRKRDG